MTESSTAAAVRLSVVELCYQYITQGWMMLNILTWIQITVSHGDMLLCLAHYVALCFPVEEALCSCSELRSDDRGPGGWRAN